LSVIEQARSDLYDVGGTGVGILESSHRSPLFEEIIAQARTRIRRLLALDDDQVVLFLHGGARTQFFMWPMNVLRGGRAAYLNTGKWSDGAIDDARRFGSVDVLFSSKATGYDRVPDPGAWDAIQEGTSYLHYTSNNTVAGSQFAYIPDTGDTPLVCDMSSDFLSRPVDGSRFAFIYSGAQKNVGPSGTTVVIMRKSWLERCDPELPAMLRYGIHVDKGSMYNTPCTFSIHVIGLVTQWIEENGGIQGIAARNDAQAQKIYGVLDGSDFWQGKVQPGSRSLMNITFTTGDDALDTTFWKEGAARGMSGLKGHRAVGGLRASVYNAQTNEAIDALVDFMNEFERRRG
jgi:phosphoserine aminotransferase